LVVRCALNKQGNRRVFKWDFKPSITYTGQMEKWSWGAQLSGTKRPEGGRNEASLSALYSNPRGLGQLQPAALALGIGMRCSYRSGIGTRRFQENS